MTGHGTKLPLLRLAALGAALLALLVLLVALMLARDASRARAAIPSGGPAGAAPAAFVDDEEEAEEDEEGEFALFGAEDESEGEGEANPCAADDEAEEEACEEALEEEEAEELMASECRLSAAEATVSTVPSQNEVRLSVRYRTLQPSAVAVELRLRGARGPLDLGVENVRFGRTGTLRATKELSDSEMRRATVAKEFTVGIHAVNSPRYCRGLFERHLTAHHGSRWSDPTADRRARGTARRPQSRPR